MFCIAVLLIIGGTWCFQDALASILFYLDRTDEKWHFNHLVRVLRACWGITFIVIGVMLIGGE